MISSHYLPIISPLLLLVSLQLFHPTSSTKPPGETHVCTRLETYMEDVEVLVEEPVKMKRYQWCVGVPPRCTVLTTELRNRTKIEAIEKNRTVSECCSGYVEINAECVPECPPNQPCPNMKCQDTKHCICLAGYTGLHCNTTCPVGRWGANCTSKCDCGEINGNKCHHLTGTCILPSTTSTTTETPTPTRIETTTLAPNTVAAVTTTTFATSKEPLKPNTEAPTTLPTIPSVLTKLEDTLDVFNPIKNFDEMSPITPVRGVSTYTISLPTIPSNPTATEEWPYTLPKLTTARPVFNEVGIKKDVPPPGLDWPYTLPELTTPRPVLNGEIANKVLPQVEVAVPNSFTTRKSPVDDLIIREIAPIVDAIPSKIPKFEMGITSRTHSPIFNTDIIDKNLSPIVDSISKIATEHPTTTKTIPYQETTPRPFSGAPSYTPTDSNPHVIPTEIKTIFKGGPTVSEAATTGTSIMNGGSIAKSISNNLNAFAKSDSVTVQATLPTLTMPTLGVSFNFPVISSTPGTKTKVIDKLNIMTSDLEKSLKSVVSSVMNELNTSNILPTTTPRNSFYNVINSLDKTNDNARFDDELTSRQRDIHSKIKNIGEITFPTLPEVRTNEFLNPAALTTSSVSPSRDKPTSLPPIITDPPLDNPHLPNILTYSTPGESPEPYLSTSTLSSLGNIARDLTPNVIAKEFNTIASSGLPEYHVESKPTVTPIDLIITQSTSPTERQTSSHITSTTLTKVSEYSSTNFPNIPPIQNFPKLSKDFSFDFNPTLPPLQNINLPPSFNPSFPPMSNFYPTLPPMPSFNLTLPPVPSFNPSFPTMSNFNPTLPPMSNFNPTIPPKENFNPTLPPVQNINPTFPPVQNFNHTLPPMSNFNPTIPPVQNFNPTLPPVQNFNPTLPPMSNFNPTFPPVKNINPTFPPVQNFNPTFPPIQNFNPTLPPIQNINPTFPPKKNFNVISSQQNFDLSVSSAFPSNSNWLNNMTPTLPSLSLTTPTVFPLPSRTPTSPPATFTPISTTQRDRQVEKSQESQRHEITSTKPPTSPPKVANPDLDKAIGIFENSLNDLMKSMEHIGMKKGANTLDSATKANKHMQNDGPRQSFQDLRIGAQGSLFSNVAAFSGDDNEFMSDRNYHPTSVGMNLVYRPQDDAAFSSDKSADTMHQLYNAGVLSASVSTLLLILTLFLAVIGYVLHRRRKSRLESASPGEEVLDVGNLVVTDSSGNQRPADGFCRFVSPHCMQLLAGKYQDNSGTFIS
ncbi:hypothetical protein M8J76_013202 [Diaphorina citri]|nr:hypothetical protein M8J76_013202 [Diaphorina citri]KAI5742496.1 hypothetical protein M8J77_007856 [Diaphorina citri]